MQISIARAATITHRPKASHHFVWIQTKAPFEIRFVTSAKGIDAQSTDLYQISAYICVANI